MSTVTAVTPDLLTTDTRRIPGPKPRTAMERRTWCVKEVAEYLGVSERTVWRWHDAGEIPKGKKLAGKTVRWAADVIVRWFEKQPAA